MSAEGIAPSLVAGFLKAQLQPIQVRKLLVQAGWTNSPMAGELELAATGHVPESAGFEKVFDFLSSESITNTQTSPPRRDGSTNHPVANPEFSINLKLSADQNGLAVSNLVITCEGAPLASLHGFLPLTLRPDSATNLLRLDRQAALACEANVQPEGPFWEGIAAWTGVGFRKPQLDLSLSGSWQDPHGRLDLEAEQIQFARMAGITLPSFEALRVSVQVDSEQARLTEGRLRIQGQPLSLTAQVPLGPDFWSGMPSKSRPDWRQATAHLTMTNVDLAAFQPLYRELLTPQGNLDVDVSLQPGMDLEGTAVLERARTRPLGELGPIRDIGATLRFTTQEVRLESATASVGRAPVQLAGRAELKGFNWLHGTLPPFELSLRGTNVLLQREPESIIRADLDVAVLKTNGAAPLISGAVHLRDSYYLRDLSALVPGKIASPDRRPPYFNITDPAVADWRLALNVEGTRFMRIRGPLFNGEVSTTLKVQGTLGDPLALGDGKVDSGYIRLPFATFQVQQGLVTLSSKDPYRPELLVTAASKQYGYDIRMEITGPADAPVVQFTSTPPLSSEQILLMVTAGEMPQATFSLTTQQRAQTVALFFGKDLLSKLGLGDQSQERLEVTSGEEISDQGRPTYNVEYKLSDRWSVVGAYDRFGDFNAGFKWLLYSK
jgi:translocation and assembly module TamB